jgi:hypothetical protein
MEHERGFRLICLGATRSKSIEFRYVKGDIALDFSADRRHWGGTVIGTYDVGANLSDARPKLGSDRWPPERAKLEAIAADIDIGLRAWPPTQADEARPIGVVHFNFVSPLSFLRSLPPIDYEFAFGEPLALRDTPHSTRWVISRAPYRDGKNKDGTDRVRNLQSLLRDDGVQIIRIPTMKGPGDDGPDTYHYVERDIVFDFTAERRLSNSVVTDTWEVELDPTHRDGFSAAKRASLGASRCAEIVRTIEEALYAWGDPARTQERQVPVNRIVFLDAP